MCEWGTDTELDLKIAAKLSHTQEARWAKVKVDSCIAAIVNALQAAGIDMLASCCGHGKEAGYILLADGREVRIMEASDESKNMWRVVETENSVHVVPTQSEHELVETCICAPTIERYAIPLVIHRMPA